MTVGGWDSKKVKKCQRGSDEGGGKRKAGVGGHDCMNAVRAPTCAGETMTVTSLSASVLRCLGLGMSDLLAQRRSICNVAQSLSSSKSPLCYY